MALAGYSCGLWEIHLPCATPRRSTSATALLSALVSEKVSVYAFLHFGLDYGPGWIPPNLVRLRRIIAETEDLLAKWIPDEGYECPLDPACNGEQERQPRA